MAEKYNLGTNGNRLIAYLIDVLPITLILVLTFYYFLGFDEAWNNYFSNKGNLEARKEFLFQRNKIRNITLLIWIIYGTLMDHTIWQGTLGKKIMGIKVADDEGNRIGFYQSFKRNFSKLISTLPLFIGIFWIFFNKKKKGIHDKIAKTLIIKG